MPMATKLARGEYSIDCCMVIASFQRQGRYHISPNTMTLNKYYVNVNTFAKT